jgi:hypothetical protein
MLLNYQYEDRRHQLLCDTTQCMGAKVYAVAQAFLPVKNLLNVLLTVKLRCFEEFCRLR